MHTIVDVYIYPCEKYTCGETSLCPNFVETFFPNYTGNSAGSSSSRSVCV